MRRWIALLFILLVLGLGALYLTIPANIPIKAEKHLSVNAKAFTRALLDEKAWHQWWPGETALHNSSSGFTYRGNRYRFVEKKLSSALLSVHNGKDSLLTELIVIPIENDSVELNWISAAKSSLNPISRLKAYSWTKTIQSDLSFLLRKLDNFYQNKDHLYGLQIREEKVVDSTLISTSAIVNFYPTTESIYNLIDQLQSFARKNGAKQTGLPMLNIASRADGTYFIKVALPVDKKLKDEGNIQYKWMLGGGNILVTEVKGGPAKIQRAFSVMEKYVTDFNRIEPAIPFQSLVTDRRTEPDTAKWVTKIYWPVM